MKKNKKKRKKLTFKRLLKIMLRNIIAFIVGALYIAIIMIFDNFNKIMSRLFKKLNKWLKVAIIYTMLILSVLYVVNPRTIIKEVKAENEKEIVFLFEEKQEEKQEKKEIVFNTEIENKIYKKALENGMLKEQAFLILAISKHETGKWQSNAFKTKNNLGGIMCNSGLKQYKTQDEGVDAFVNLLKNRYFNKGLDSVEKIGDVYCPIGADNDPYNVNQYWIPNVTRYFDDYLKNY